MLKWNEHGMSVQKTLIHNEILEGSEGVARNLLDFSFVRFLSLGLPRVKRVHKGPPSTYLSHKRRKLEIDLHLCKHSPLQLLPGSRLAKIRGRIRRSALKVGMGEWEGP